MEDRQGQALEQITFRAIRDIPPQNQGIFMHRLVEFLARRTMRYTMDDSSSVPVETAQELLNSILFTLGCAGVSVDEVLHSPLEQVWQVGLREIEARVDHCRALYEHVRATAPKAESLSYWDTVVGIGGFFKQYDHRFLAHQIPCDIDYQLMHPVPEALLGVDYISRYLTALVTENRLMACFDQDAARLVLARHCPDYSQLLVNLCEPLVTNALGLAVLEQPPHHLAVTHGDCAALLARFGSCTAQEARELLDRAGEALCDGLEVYDLFSIRYVRDFARTLQPRIFAAAQRRDLSHIFIPMEED